MGSLTKGSIVLYPFPFTNLAGKKLRPCLVLSEEMGEDILLCQITSQHLKKDFYSVSLGKDETINGTLKINSYIRCNMLFTAEKNQIKKILCKIPNKKYGEVIKK